jgi:hypothetical protein
VTPRWWAEVCWQAFVASGSVWAYLGYRCALRAALLDRWCSLN